MIIDNLKHCNDFTIIEFEKEYYSKTDINYIAKRFKQGEDTSLFKHCKLLGQYSNRIMDIYKETFNLNLWNTANKMLITNQMTSPGGNESLPTSDQIMYTADDSMIAVRIPGNPYFIDYQITDIDANSKTGDGQWGSICFITANSVLINRARVSINKSPNKIVYVSFRARVQ